MGFFDFLKQANINRGIEEYKRTAGAVLLDVRTSQEYQEGHIPESKNVPLQQLNNVVSVAKNTEIPLFVYCYSGARSRQAIHRPMPLAVLESGRLVSTRRWMTHTSEKSIK